MPKLHSHYLNFKVIVTGDFFQLPPVTKGNAQTKFAFEAHLWNETIKRTFNLTKVFRQRDAGARAYNKMYLGVDAYFVHRIRGYAE